MVLDCGPGRCKARRTVVVERWRAARQDRLTGVGNRAHLSRRGDQEPNQRRRWSAARGRGACVDGSRADPPAPFGDPHLAPAGPRRTLAGPRSSRCPRQSSRRVAGAATEVRPGARRRRFQRLMGDPGRPLKSAGRWYNFGMTPVPSEGPRRARSTGRRTPILRPARRSATSCVAGPGPPDKSLQFGKA